MPASHAATVQERSAPPALDRTVREALWLGEGHLQAGDFASAERAFSRIVQDEPRCAEAWFFLGLVCQHARDPRERSGIIVRSPAWRPTSPRRTTTWGSRSRIRTGSWRRKPASARPSG